MTANCVDAAISVSRMLKLWGHEVVTAFNGLDALEKAHTFKSQVVLLDIGMPGMSGYDVAKQLRAERQSDAVVITALTEYGIWQAEHRLRSKEAGFAHYMTKPPDPTIPCRMLAPPQVFSGPDVY